MPCMLHAQPDFVDDVVDDVPVDGGLSLLVAAGIGYSARKMKKRNTKWSCLDFFFFEIKYTRFSLVEFNWIYELGK